MSSGDEASDVIMSASAANEEPTLELDDSTSDDDENTSPHHHRRHRRRRRAAPLKRLSQRLSVLRRESLPETPAGWTVLVAALASAGLGYEVQLQQSLTQPPLTFGTQTWGRDLHAIHAKLTRTPESILSRDIQPSLWVGTRGQVASAAAYVAMGKGGGGPTSQEGVVSSFREVVTSRYDGARIGIDWWHVTAATTTTKDDDDQQQQQQQQRRRLLKGPITEPVVVILHGINNHAHFGYMQSLARTFATRGWNAAAVNFRGVGCGGVPLATPRSYTASYTGDLRSLVHTLSGRMAPGVPLFLVGNSLGANLVAKYLGEEGFSGTLPSCVAGGAALGNPMLFRSDHIAFPYSVAMGQARKVTYLRNYPQLVQMKDAYFQQLLRKALFGTATLAGLDAALAPVQIRNDTFYPFTPKIGYKDAETYWLDSGSYRLTRFIAVPFLHLTAKDDFLVYPSSKNKSAYTISNPNVMIVETRCGGHLGWQERPPNTSGSHGMSTSWADAATADFFQATMDVNQERSNTRSGAAPGLAPTEPQGSLDVTMEELEQMKEQAAVHWRRANTISKL